MNQYLTKIKTSPAQRAAATAIILIVFIGLLHFPPIFRAIGAEVVLWIDSLTNISAALLGVWLGFLLWRSFRRGESLSIIWGSLTTGLILWTIGDLIWGSEHFLHKATPNYSFSADIAWILGYFAVIVGLVVRFYTFKVRPKLRWQFAVLGIFWGVTILVILYLVIPILNDPRIGNSYEKFIDLFYPIGDLILAFLAILIVLVLEGGLLSKPWVIIASGCFFIATADLLYAFAAWQGIYQVDPTASLDFVNYAIGFSFALAYILMALGLYLQARLQGAV